MKNITFEERKMIEKMQREKIGIRAMSRIMKRSHSSISDELKRNKMPYEKQYVASTAHERFLRRQNNKGNKSKLEQNPELKQFIIKQLTKDQWSPEQIAGFMKLLKAKQIISHETIYQFIYSEEGKRLKLWLNLRHRKRPKRQPHGQRKTRKITIKYRVSIKERPGIANDRKELGHLESDSMIFSAQKPILSVQVERMTQKCIITKFESKQAKETKYAIEKSIEEYGQSIVKSITYDNGTENARHYEINEDYGIKSYFCRAYASWQKGLVENINKLIRQYFPLHINMENLTDNEVYEIQEKLNNRPRKALKYLTPNQAYQILSMGGRIRA